MKTLLKWLGGLSLALLLLLWGCKKDPDPVAAPAVDDKVAFPNQQRGSNFLSSAQYEAIPQIATPAARGGRQIALPDSFDLSPEMPPVGDQGPQGSCVGWATTYAMRSYLEHYTKKTVYLNGTTPNNDVLFSPAFVYNLLNEGKDRGLFMSDALNLLKTQGSTTLADMPYVPSDFTTQPTAKQKDKATGFKVKNWGRISISIAEIKAFLSNNNPVIFGMDVDANMTKLVDRFGAEKGWKTFDKNSVRGGHAMVIVGYNNAKNAFKVQNSWGTSWGNKGFFWMSYDLTSNIREAYVVTVEGKEFEFVGPVGKSSSKDIISFDFLNYGTDKANAYGSAIGSLRTVDVTVGPGTDLTKLVPTIGISEFATVSPATGVAQDFSKPVQYVVTAEDGTKATHTVTVKVAATTAFLLDYTIQPMIENVDPTTLRIKKAITIKSTPKAESGYAYWYGYNYYETPNGAASDVVYAGQVKEATNLSFDLEIKGLTPNTKYIVQPFVYRIACEDAAGPKGPACKDVRVYVNASNVDRKANIAAKTTDFPDKSDNTINSYKNVRVVISKGAAADGDSCLLDLKNGKVYPLKDGAKNAANVDLVFAANSVRNLELYSPTANGNPVYATLQTQAWSTYRKTYISIGSPDRNAASYPYTWIGGWSNINNVADLDKFQASTTFNNEGGVGSYDASGGTFLINYALFGLRTTDGKKGLARLTELKVTATTIVLVMDIKMAK